MYRNPNIVYVKEEIANLKDYAKSKGFKIIFRNHPTHQGDFCIFIYKPNYNGYHTRYLVGYDGDYNVTEDSPLNFDNCINASYNFIKNYKD